MELAAITLYKTLVMVILALTGVFSYRAGIVDESMNRNLSELVLTLFTPVLLFTSFQKEFSQELLSGLGISVVLSFLSFAVIWFICKCVVYGRDKDYQAVELIAMMYSNCGFIGIPMVIALGRPPLALTGTALIMLISFVVRRMPYTIRSATATLMQIPMSIEEASISLGASKLKTFAKITVPMMSNGIISGAILSWVSIVTELSSSIILYNNKNITLTMSAYVAISRGNYGLACAFSAILTVLTAISLLVYLWVSKSEDIKL